MEKLKIFDIKFNISAMNNESQKVCTFICTICKREFTSQGALKLHKCSMCSECQITFSKSFNLERHKQRCHRSDSWHDEKKRKVKAFVDRLIQNKSSVKKPIEFESLKAAKNHIVMLRKNTGFKLVQVSGSRKRKDGVIVYNYVCNRTRPNFKCPKQRRKQPVNRKTQLPRIICPARAHIIDRSKAEIKSNEATIQLFIYHKHNHNPEPPIRLSAQCEAETIEEYKDLKLLTKTPSHFESNLEQNIKIEDSAQLSELQQFKDEAMQLGMLSRRMQEINELPESALIQLQEHRHAIEQWWGSLMSIDIHKKHWSQKRKIATQ